MQPYAILIDMKHERITFHFEGRRDRRLDAKALTKAVAGIAQKAIGNEKKNIEHVVNGRIAIEAKQASNETERRAIRSKQRRDRLIASATANAAARLAKRLAAEKMRKHLDRAINATWLSEVLEIAEEQ